MSRTKRSLLYVSALLAVLFAAPLTAQVGNLRYTVTVTEFENQAGWASSWSIGDAWGAVMTEKLHATGRFIVLGESDMRGAALDEQDLAASGRTAQGAKAPVTGQLTPAQILVKGAITHVQSSTEGGGGGIRVRGIRVGGNKGKAELNATIYMVDSTTGQVMASQSVTGVAGRRGGALGYSGSDFGGDFNAYKNDNVGRAVEDAVAEAVDWLVSQLGSVPWTGSVAMIRDGQVYVNRGSREGVSAGQEFVVGEADVIRDPDTGEVLDTEVKQVARLKASSVREKLTICDVVSGDAASVQQGMMVSLP
ncbi:MAG TPA: CsgG/HfaB family protein [Thermoanaerobaculia bacterium]|nr:CsgG/HfaB family protein [Thermoanaerobaculia bacterium]